MVRKREAPWQKQKQKQTKTQKQQSSRSSREQASSPGSIANRSDMPRHGRPLHPGTLLQLSFDSALRSIASNIEDLACLMSTEGFAGFQWDFHDDPPKLHRIGGPRASLRLPLGSGEFGSRYTATGSDCESTVVFSTLSFESNADSFKPVSVGCSNHRNRRSVSVHDAESDFGKCVPVGLREQGESVGRVGDSASSTLRSAELRTLSKQKGRGPPAEEGFVVLSSEHQEGFRGGQENACKEGESKAVYCNDNVGDPSNRHRGTQAEEPGKGWIGKAASASLQAKALMKEITALERAQIGAAAGGIAGALTYACLHPLDTVKTKLQTRGASDLYSGPIDVIVKTFKNQGVLGFYSGISAVLVGSMFSSAVYFGTCELGKALFSQVPIFPPVAVPPLAGAMGNLASSAILVPKEVITQRMQAGAVGRSWEVLLRTIEKEGVGGLYTGYSAALVRNLPASVLSFSSFEYLKAAWLRKSGQNRLEPWQSMTSGALAGAISAALTTPLDVVKTRLMTQARITSVERLAGASTAKIVLMEAEMKAKLTAATYKGISSTLRQIWLEEGWIGLTRGVVPRLLYSACFSALGYFAFETARLALVKRHIAKRKEVLLLPNKPVLASPAVL